MSGDGFYLPSTFTREEEEKIIEKVARLIVRSGMEVPATMFLQMISPISYMGAHFGLLILAPLLPLFGDRMENLIAFFSKRENVEKVIERVEALKKESEEKSRTQ